MLYHYIMKPSILTDQIDDNFETACQHIAESGLKHCEIHSIFGKTVEQLTEAQAIMAKEILQRYGLSVTNIASTIYFMCKLHAHYSISLFKPEFKVTEGEMTDHLQALENACRIADILDCRTVRIFPFRYPDQKVQITAETFGQIEYALRKAAAVALRHDKILVLENCPYSHLPKGEMTIKIVEDIHSDHLKLLWDPGNSYRAEKDQVPDRFLHKDLLEEFDRIKDSIAHIHLKNYKYVPGQEKPFVHTDLLSGDIDMEQLVKAVEAFENRSGKELTVSLEPETDSETAIRCINQLKAYLKC